MSLCHKGCGRPAFGEYDSCCVKCTGDPEEDHNKDCAAKAERTTLQRQKRPAEEEAVGEAGAWLRAAVLRPKLTSDGCNGPCACLNSPEVELLDGLTFTWQQHVGPAAVKYHGSDITFKFINCGGPRGSCNWESPSGHLSYGQTGAPPLLVRKLAAGLTWRGGHSSSATQGRSEYSTSFKKEAGVDFDLQTSQLLLELDEAGSAEAEAERLTALQEPLAFADFVDKCGASLHVLITSTDVSNKATYIDLAVSTPGGSAFELKVRLGGTFVSEKHVLSRLKKDPVGSLEEFAGLGEGGVSTCTVRLTTKGDDLDISPAGFVVHPPSVPAKGAVHAIVHASASRGIPVD